jgi:uncharacterized protein (TIGR03085 family)
VKLTTLAILPLGADNYDRPVTDYGRLERHALCDLLDRLGPDHPTLCDGWTTHDLVVHLHVREADPLAGPGLMIPALSDTTERRMAQARERYGYSELVDKVRQGPPRFSIYAFPRLGAQLNVMEYFVHHEDVRRAGADVRPRSLPASQQQGLWKQLRVAARALTRKAPCGVVLRLPDGAEAVVKKPTELGSVTVTGEAAELVLFCFGRGAVAEVDLTGEPGAVERLRGTSFRA